MSQQFEKLNFKKSYDEFVKYNFENYPPEKAVEISCGGNREAYGHVERQILIKFGLKPNHSMVDVGCGYGRLAENLTDYLTAGSFLGLDVVKQLVDYAREHNKQYRNFNFEVAPGLSLPVANESIDFISVFSVFTHMLHEDTFLYLEDMKRALKSKGRIIISFLEFTNQDHWPVFIEQIRPRRGSTPGNLYQQTDTPYLNPGIMFTERSMYQMFAKEIGFELVGFEEGNKKTIPLGKPIKLENGENWTDFGTIGQTLCILQKP